MKIILLAFVSVFMLVNLISCENQSADIVKHKINNDIFVKVPTRWPSEEQSVTVILSDKLPQDYKACDGLKGIISDFFKDKSTRLSMGQYCNTLFVLINYPKLMESNKTREFAVAHESFHIAHQIYGTPYIIGLELDNRDVGFVKGFSSLLKSVLVSTEQQFECKKIEAYLDSLTRARRNLVLYKATYEWPAEFYAKELVFGGNTEGYLKMRNTVFSDNLNSFYKLSHLVINNVESKVGRKKWQSRVNKGKSLFDLLMKVNGCKEYTKGFIRVDVDEWKLPEFY